MSEAEAPRTDEEAPKGFRSLFRRYLFDDRVDVEPEIDTRQTLVLLGRSLTYLRDVKFMFAMKFGMSLVSIVPFLLLPWTGKIVTDYVLLEKPLEPETALFPPFMHPLLAAFSTITPIQIITTLAIAYAVLLIIFGVRAGGTGAGLFEGRDAATQAENRISSGGSEAGGLWGILEFAVNVRLTQNIVNAFRVRLFRNLTHLPMTTLDDQRIGDSIYRVLYDTPLVAEICYRIVMEPVHILIAALIQLYLMSYTYQAVLPEVVLIAWGMFPLILVLTFPVARLVRRTNQAKRAAGAATTNAIEESSSNIVAVQSLGGMQQEQDKFAQKSDESFRRDRYALAVGLFLLASAFVFGIVMSVWVYVLITDAVIEGLLTPGDFVVLLVLFFEIAFTASALGAYWTTLQEQVAGVRRVYFFLDYQSEEDESGSDSLETLTDGVVMEDVDYQYPNGSQVLTDINVNLELGKLYAVVGPTGAGKTTLAYLIPAFLRPTRGRVLVDGHDLRSLDLSSLRKLVTFVYQEHVLMSSSIRDNMLLSNPEATDDDIHAALERTGCTEFIGQLPDGIDTVLGKAGDTLSMGQQQRLSVARGLLRDTPILILDEPTSALDPTTERDFVETLHKARADKLIVIIAHRLSTIRHADQILFLEDGEVQDMGSHDELMANEAGSYRRFVELQLQSNVA